jgi:hypothetical protein
LATLLPELLDAALGDLKETLKLLVVLPGAIRDVDGVIGAHPVWNMGGSAGVVSTAC